MFCISNKKTNIHKRVNNKFIIKTNFLSIRTLFKKYIDVYFYFRVHNFGGYEFIQKSKIVVFNSKRVISELRANKENIEFDVLNKKKIKKELDKKDAKKNKKAKNKTSKQNKTKAIVLYPHIDKVGKIDTKAKEKKKKKLLAKMGVKTKNKQPVIVYFCAKDFKRGGLDYVLGIFNSINKALDVKLIIGSRDKMQIKYAQEISGITSDDKNVLFTSRECFDISDIFLLPTKNKNFATSILKAMSNKCCVFLPKHNDGSEILDEFGVMYNERDNATMHKIEALALDRGELKKAQEIHYKIAKNIYAYNKMVIKYLNNGAIGEI